MQVGGGGPEAEDEEASGRGQTTLTNFFPARFKGAPQHKGVPLKHAGKPLATPDAAKTQGAHERPTSLHGRLNARIEHARACTANKQASLLLEICCLKKASRCRSVGVKMGPAPAPRAETASALRAARLVNASHTDFTQLDPTDAIGTVAEAARTFSKSLYMMRSTEDALPSGNAFLAAAASALIASRSSSRMAHGLQCNEDMRLCGRDAGDQRSRTSRESSTAAAMTSDMWSGVLRSGAASMESSPCGKGRAGAVREGIMVRASGGGAGRGESLGGSESAGVSEDEHSRKRRYGSISSASSLEPTEFAVWHAGSPSRQRIFASAPEGSPDGKQQQRGGSRSLQGKPSSSSSSSSSSSKLATLPRRVHIKHDVPTQRLAAGRSPRRACVASPFGFTKPSSFSGENTLAHVNQALMVWRHVTQVVQQTSRHQEAHDSAASLRHLRGESPLPASCVDVLAWPGGAGMASVPPQTPPRGGDMALLDTDAADALLQCDENLHEESALYLSPRADAQHNMLVIAPGLVAPVSAAHSGARSASSLINITPFLACNPFQLSPNRCGTGAAQQLAQGMSAAAADLDSQPSGAAAAASLIAHR